MRNIFFVGWLWIAFFAMPLNAQVVPTHPLPEIITAENVRQLQEIGEFGRGAATALHWHPTGEVLAVGSSTGVWLLDKNLQILENTPIQQHITDLAWSPDGKRIAVVSNRHERCTIQIWDEDFTASQPALDYCAGTVKWNADSKYLAIFDFNPATNEILLIDANNDEITILPGQDGAWSPSGSILLTLEGYTQTSNDLPRLNTWSVDTKELLFTLGLTDDRPEILLWGIDEQTLAIGCQEIEAETDSVNVGICSLDARTGRITRIQEITSYYSGQARFDPIHIAWNTEENLLALVQEHFVRGFLNDVLILDTGTNTLASIGDGVAFDWNPKVNEITVIVGNGKIKTFRADTNEVLAESQWFTAPVNMIAVRPNGDHIASTGFGYEQYTRVWDIGYSWADPLLTFYAEPAEIVDYSSDGHELIAGGTIITDIVANQQIDAFNPNTGERIRSITAFYDQGSSPAKEHWNADYTEMLSLPKTIPDDPETFSAYIAWSPDYSKVAIVEQSIQDYDFHVRIWDAVTGEFINQFAGGMFAFVGMEWSPDSTRIAVLLQRFEAGSGNGDQGIRIFSAIAGQNYQIGEADYEVLDWINREESLLPAQVAWNSDGTLIAVTLTDRLEIHDPTGDGTPLITLPACEITDLEWSSDNRFIAAGSDDGTIRMLGIPSNR